MKFFTGNRRQCHQDINGLDIQITIIIEKFLYRDRHVMTLRDWNHYHIKNLLSQLTQNKEKLSTLNLNQSKRTSVLIII